MHALNARRGGLTLNPLVFLLLLALVAVMVWRGWVILDILRQTAPQLSGGARSAGVIIGCVIGGLIVCALAGGIGIALYFICGRSDGAANGGIGLVLLLAVGWIAYGTYAASTTPIPAPALAGNGTLGGARTPGAGGLRDEMEAMAERQRQTLERARQVTEASRQAALDQMNRTRDAARDAGQSQPTGTPPTPGPSTLPSTSPSPGQATGTPGSVPPMPPVRQSDAATEQKAKAALDPVREEIRSRATAFLTEADVMVDALSKPPRAVRSELDKRAKDAADLVQKANSLESYFRTIDERVERALKDAGLDKGDQIRQGMAFRQSLDTFGKASACGSYQRLFEAASDEAEALKESAGRWNYDASGQVTSKDFSLQSKLRHLREGVSTYRRGIARARATIAGDGGN